MVNPEMQRVALMDPETQQVFAMVDVPTAWAWAVAAEDARYTAALRRPPAPTPLELVEQTRQQARGRAAAQKRWRARRAAEVQAAAQRVQLRAQRDAELDAFHQRARALVLLGIRTETARPLAGAGYSTLEALRRAPDTDLLALRQIGPGRLAALRRLLNESAPPPPDWIAEE